MSGHIVYEGVSRSRDENEVDLNLFGGQKLWFAHAMPQRTFFIENAQRLGAVIVKVDVEADIRLVDHTKKLNAPGTYSYKYVEDSIRRGALQDLTSYAIGPSSRVSRPVGSTRTAPKPGRASFSEEEDQLLWNWIQPFVDRGGAWKGNEIYKQLEEVNPRHTFQSWRDRWIKHTQYQKRRVTATVEPQDRQRQEPVAGPSRASPLRKRRREADDDGEAQRAQQVQSDRAARPIPRRRPPRTLQIGDHTYEQADEDALVGSTQDTALPQTSERAVDDTNVSLKQQSEEQRTRRIRNKVSLETGSPAAVPVHKTLNPAAKTISTRASTPSTASGSKGVLGGPSSKPQPRDSRKFSRIEYAEVYYLFMVLLNDKDGNALTDYEKPWEDFAAVHDSHTAAQWKDYCRSKVVPEHCKEHNLYFSDVASRIFGEPYDINHTTDPLIAQQIGSDTTDTTSCEEDIRCEICETSNLVKRREGAEGRILCAGCVEMVSSHGFRRASRLWNEQGKMDDAEHRDRSKQERVEGEPSNIAATTKCDNLDVPTNVLPPPGSINRSKQLSAAVSENIAKPSRPTRKATPERSHRSRSPSFRPESPTSLRPLESNISRKRSAGKSTQSQSTQPSNANSQNTKSSSQSQGQDAEGLTADMGAEQSTESNAKTSQPPVTASRKVAPSPPSFQATSKGKRKQLHDEPTILPTQQDSSLSTDGAPAGQRSVHNSSGSDHDKAKGPGSIPTTLPTLNTPSEHFKTQVHDPWLFCVETESINNEDGGQEEQEGPERLKETDNERAFPPVLVDLVSEGLDVNVDSQSTSEHENEEMDQDVHADIAELVPPNKRQISEEFETAQETPENYETAQEAQSEQISSKDGKTDGPSGSDEEEEDFDMTELPEPPEGFLAYGIGASVMPPDEDSMDDEEVMEIDVSASIDVDRVVTEEAEKSPRIKLEDGSSLQPLDQALLPLEYTPHWSIHDADELVRPVEAQDAVRHAEKKNSKQDGADTDSEFNKEMRIDAQEWKAERQEAERLELQRVERARRESRRSEAQRSKAPTQDQGPSSTTAVEGPAQATSSSKLNIERISKLNANAWLAEQRELYPKVRVLEPILFRAIESTGYDNVDLTSQVVKIMVENRKKHIKQLLRSLRKKALSNADIDAPDHEAFLPQDTPGVWTKRDDDDLTKGEEQQNRVLGKHGRTRCVERFDYLSDHV